MARQQYLALLAAIGLSACAAEPAATLARVALDGATLAITGKSLDGHGLTAITGQDCDLVRSLSSEPVCRPNGEPYSDATVTNGVAEPGHSALWTVYGGEAAHGSVQLDIPSTPPFARRQEPQSYVVISSFRDANDASHAALGLRGLHAEVTQIDMAGIVYHRVVVGPIDEHVAPTLHARLAAAGIQNTFPVLLCPGDLSSPPCFAGSRYRPLPTDPPSSSR